MPELPEVEAARSFLADRLTGRVIAGVQLVDFAALKTYSPGLDALIGLEVDGVARHGKFIDVSAQGVHLIFHLARAGWLRWSDALPTTPARPGKGPLSLRVALDDGAGFEITEAGTQRKVAVYVVTEPEDVPGIVALGPEPLDDAFTVDALQAIVKATGKGQLKGMLRDQKVIAGIGNAYSDEILHAARLSPFKGADTLTPNELATLFDAIKTTLGTAVERAVGLDVAALKDDKRANFRVHARTGQACDVCGTTIAEVSFADSSLQYCPGCQTGGRTLADRRMSKLLK